MKIGIIDDSTEIHDLLRQLLASNGHMNTFSYLNAEDGLKACEAELPDVLLLDVKLPGMDGLSALKAIKESEWGKDTPVIIMTAHGNDDYIHSAFQLGATDFINKPIRKVDLLARIHGAFHLKREMDRRKSYEQELYQLARTLSEANAELQIISMIDTLTGISNRRHFEDMIEMEWKYSKQHANPLSLLMIDVDQFKKYNDSQGHTAGDECLRKIAQAMGRSIQRPGDIVARYGGEEFVVILPSTNMESAAVVGERILEFTRQLDIPHPVTQRGFVTVSIGGATTSPSNHTHWRALLEAADKAMYIGKRAGGNSYVAASP